MKTFVKLLISFVLYIYSFGAIWAATLSTSDSRNIHWYILSIMVVVALLSLWVFTWFNRLRLLSVIGLFLAFFICVPYMYIAFPKILYLVGPALPIIVLSLLYIIIFWRKANAHNKA